MRRSGRWRRGALIGGVGVLVAVVVFAVGVFVGTIGLQNSAAADPADLLDEIAEAGVVCLQVASLVVEHDHKTLGCATQTNGILTVETWGRRPSPDDWLAERCAMLADFDKAEVGAYVVFPEGIIRVANGAIPIENNIERETPQAIGDRLATSFGGTSTLYECP